VLEQRLEASFTALDGIHAPTRSSAETADSAAPSGRRRPSRRRSSAPRALRGANRAAVLRVLADRPGVSSTALSSASGVTKPVLDGLLKTLEQRGEIARQQLPGGATGYGLPAEGVVEAANAVAAAPSVSS
jgi:DNA-binding HxlR family transcriptional regulator